MKKSSLIKISFAVVTSVVAISAIAPQKAFARETATVPIVLAPVDKAVSAPKDNTTVPIIVTPSTPVVTANPAPLFGDVVFTLSITVNEAPTVDTPLTLTTNHGEAIGLPGSVVIPAGLTTVTTTVTVTAGDFHHHKNVKIQASANGVSIETQVKVHYVHEND